MNVAKIKKARINFNKFRRFFPEETELGCFENTRTENARHDMMTGKAIEISQTIIPAPKGKGVGISGSRLPGPSSGSDCMSNAIG
ncbi:hypothetical protein [Corynebacterium striatum]|uniref:hypothetical protein n=1 Tax=Corynebacterium striatum TaxID=43770 RepID=UPI0011C0353E|nr:hypothetical protein [Corynebacterium striatum]